MAKIKLRKEPHWHGNILNIVWKNLILRQIFALKLIPQEKLELEGILISVKMNISHLVKKQNKTLLEHSYDV